MPKIRSAGRLPSPVQRMTVARSVALAVLALVIPTHDAFAYVDPNVAGWLFQILLPLFAAVLAVWAYLRNRFVSIWRRILSLFQRRDIQNDRSAG